MFTTTTGGFTAKRPRDSTQSHITVRADNRPLCSDPLDEPTAASCEGLEVNGPVSIRLISKPLLCDCGGRRAVSRSPSRVSPGRGGDPWGWRSRKIDPAMYIPKHFSIADSGRGYDLIEENPFGMLICPTGEAVPEIAHVPFVLDRPANALRVHVARANRIAQLIQDRAPVVAVFTGPHAYVSPSWYEDPAMNVPTWNYAAVHVHGVARRMTARANVLRDLAAMTARYEAASEAPWSLASVDAGHIDKLAGAVAAFEIVIERLDVKFKMSQNRPVLDRARVVSQLRVRNGPGDTAVADLVEDLNGLRDV
jgi:transcriptional regulator